MIHDVIHDQNILIGMLIGNEEYRKHYAKYKARVEKRYFPKKLLTQLPYEVKMELIRLWEKEIRKVRQ